jgi:hypothetical protein
LLACALVVGVSPAYAQDPSSARLQKLQDGLKGAEKAPVGRDWLTSEAALKNLIRKNDPQSLFFWVRDQIAFEPYEGSRRGARGALLSRSGNSLDQALLLQELLQRSGRKARLAWGELEPKKAEELLLSFTGAGALDGAPPNASLYKAAQDRGTLRAIKKHWWVEVEDNKQWVALDPSFPRAVFGVANAPRGGEAEVLPEPETVKLSVQLYLQDSSARGPRSLLTWDAPLSDMGYLPLRLAFRDGGKDRLAILNVGQKEQAQGAYRPDTAQRLWLQITTDLGGRARQTVTRELWSSESQTDLFAGELPVFGLVVLPGWSNPHLRADATLRELPQLHANLGKLPAISEQRRQGSLREQEAQEQTRALTEDLLGRAAWLAGLTFCELSDQAALSLGRQMGVRPFYDAPRVVIVGAARQDDRLLWHIDLRQNDLQALPWDGAPKTLAYAFQAARGRFDSQFEGAALSKFVGQPVATVPQLLDIAELGKIPLITLTPAGLDQALASLKLSDEAKGRLTLSVREQGHFALVPQRSVPLASVPTAAWWEFSARGAILGVHENGTYGANTGPLLTGTPNPTPRAGEPGALLLEDLLGAVEPLSASSLGLLQQSPNLCPVLCTSLTGLDAIAPRLCQTPGKPSAWSRDPELAACLGPEPQQEGDFLGLKQGCADALRPTRCGALVGGALLRGELKLTPTQAPLSARAGSWEPAQLPALDAAACKCK